MKSKFVVFYFFLLGVYLLASMPLNYIIGNFMFNIPCNFPSGISLGFPPIYYFYNDRGVYNGGFTRWIVPNLLIVYLIFLYVVNFSKKKHRIFPSGNLFANAYDKKISTFIKIAIFIILFVLSLPPIIEFFSL